MLWISTNYHNFPVTTNYATLRAHFFNRCTNFHMFWKNKQFMYSGRTTGIEPASEGVTVLCLTTWLRPPDTWSIQYQRTRLMSIDSSCSNPSLSIFKEEVVWIYKLKKKIKERITWLEHATSNLEGWHSTIELHPLINIIIRTSKFV